MMWPTPDIKLRSQGSQWFPIWAHHNRSRKSPSTGETSENAPEKWWNDELRGMFLLDIFGHAFSCICLMTYITRMTTISDEPKLLMQPLGVQICTALTLSLCIALYTLFGFYTDVFTARWWCFSFPGTTLRPCGRKINSGYLLRSV